MKLQIYSCVYTVLPAPSYCLQSSAFVYTLNFYNHFSPYPLSPFYSVLILKYKWIMFFKVINDFHLSKFNGCFSVLFIFLFILKTVLHLTLGQPMLLLSMLTQWPFCLSFLCWVSPLKSLSTRGSQDSIHVLLLFSVHTSFLGDFIYVL